MDINYLFETVKKIGGIRFRRIQGNVKCRHPLDKLVTSRNWFPVDGILITITQYCNSSMELSINCY